jgi:hypothetical protein
LIIAAAVHSPAATRAPLPHEGISLQPWRLRFRIPWSNNNTPAPVSGGQFFPGTSEKDREHCHFSMISTKTLGEKVNILIVVRANSLRIVQIQF